MSTTSEYLTHASDTFLGTVTAPEGYYLLPEGAVLADGDLNFAWDRKWYPALALGFTVSRFTAFTYARKLPPGGDTARWAWSIDEEHYSGSYATPEEAFIAGVDEADIDDDQTIYVGRLSTPDPVCCLRAGPVIKQIRESLGDTAPDFCDNILPDPSGEQFTVLETLLQNAYAGWLARYPDQRPQWFTIAWSVLEKTGAEIRELYEPET